MAMQNMQVAPVHALTANKGTYLLVLESHKQQAIQIGKYGEMSLKRGIYLYIGSAFGSGGIKARVGRHLADGKSLRWHIDYLRRVSDVCAVYVSYEQRRLEDDWVERFVKSGDYTSPMSGFGASDSSNTSHLFFTRNEPSREIVRQVLASDSLVWIQPERVR